MRRSTSEPAVPGVSASAAGSTAGMPDQNTASGNAILHPQDSAKSRKKTHVDAARASRPC